MYSGYAYNVDAATGGKLYRYYALHEDGLSRSLRRFIDRYGSGPYLRRVASQLAQYIINDHGAESLTSSKVPLAQPHPAFSLPTDAPSSIHNPDATAHSPLRPQRIRLDDIDDVQVPTTAGDLPLRPRTSRPRVQLTDAELQRPPIIEPRPRTRPDVDLIQPRPKTSRIRIPLDDDLIQPRPLTRLRNAAA
jgi:hypothetical protein